MITFKKIDLANWRQFKSVHIDFDKQVTVLTGQNSSGKTTLLNILGKHFGWDINFISTPYISKKRKKRIWSDVIKIRDSEVDDETNSTINVGSIEYSNDVSCGLTTPTYVKSQYQLQFQNQQGVFGLHIPSHRPAISYQQISQIPTDPKTVQQHYQEFQQLLFQTYGSQNVRNPGIILKQSLVSLALFGEGNKSVIGNKEYEKLFVGFQDILRKILPDSLGFQRLEIRMPDVILITNSGQFSLDAMSGGINNILGMAWQIYMYGADKESCTVIIDEPENHLHPSMQRSVLPSFAKAFPEYKFIVATHSPFIVSSMPEAKVFGLVYNKNNKITSTEIGEADLSGTPNKILREIFDVPSILPIWVEEKIKTVLASLGELEGEEKAKRILDELDKLGLSDQITDIPID
jgi:predicted ATPase